MSFLDKIKQLFGFTGVKVNLTAPAHISKSHKHVEGSVFIESGTAQQVLSVEVKLLEEWITGRGNDASSEEFTLGSIEFADPFELKAGETRSIPWAFDYEFVQSSADKLQEKGGVMGALGTASKWSSGERSAFKIIATIDLEGTAFDPSAEQSVTLNE